MHLGVLAIQEHLVALANLDHPEFQVFLESKVPLVIAGGQVLLVPLDNQVLLDLKVLKERLVLKAALVPWVSPAQLDPLVNEVFPVCLVLLVPRVFEEKWEPLVRLVWKANAALKDHLVLLVFLDPLDLLVPPASQVPPVQMESVVPLAFLVVQETRVPSALPDLRVVQAHKVFQAQSVQVAPSAPLVSEENGEKWDPRASKDLLARVAKMEHQVFRETRERRERLVPKEPKVIVVLSVFKVCQVLGVLQATRVPWDLQVGLAHLENLVQRVPQVAMVVSVLKVSWARQDPAVHLVKKERLVHLVLQDLQVLLVPLVNPLVMMPLQLLLFSAKVSLRVLIRFKAMRWTSHLGSSARKLQTTNAEI